MEYARHYVRDSGNSTLRGFFSSDAVDFDPPSLSLRTNIMKANAKSVYTLADGATGDDEEDEIKNRLVYSHNSYELIRMVKALGDWAGMDDELPEGHLDYIAREIAQVLDQRDFVVYQFTRRYLAQYDYNGSPTLGDCLDQILRWPGEFRSQEFDHVLGQKPELLLTITSMTMRDRSEAVKAAAISQDTLNRYIAATVPRKAELLALIHEVRYRTTVCFSLRALEFKPLYRVLADTVDASLPLQQRKACKQVFLDLSKEIAAAARAVELLGTNENKTTVARFLRTVKAATENFSDALPSPGAVGAILQALDTVGTTFGELITVVTNLPDTVTNISVPDLLDSSSDDDARALIDDLDAQNWLAHLGFTLKSGLIKALLSGSTDDDDENAINKVLNAARAYDQAELYQLTAAGSWESLYSSMNGDEYDTMESTLNSLG